MRKDILTKLKSNSGASLMAALLFFIMCATVGSFVLAAATASSGRLAGLKRNEQAHYAVNSAADLIAGLVQDENSKVIIQLTKEYPSKKTTKKAFINPNNGSELAEYDSITNQIVLPYLVKTVYPALDYDSAFPGISAMTGTQTIQVGVPGYDDLSVNAKYTLDESLNLSVEITPAVSGVTSFEKVTMHFKPVVEETEKITHHNMNETDDKRNSVYLKTYTIRWTDPVME